MQNDTVQVGSKVGVEFLDYEEEEVYDLTENKNPDIFKNEISVESPIGKAILGCKVGETVIYKADNRMNHIRIVGIMGND